MRIIIVKRPFFTSLTPISSKIIVPEGQKLSFFLAFENAEKAVSPLNIDGPDRIRMKTPYFLRFLLYKRTPLPYHRVDQRRAQNIL
jgi:hypothetical protein